MRSAEVEVLPREGARVSPYVHGALVEHLGKCVYDGIWDTGRGLPRADVQAAVRALGTTMFRYPGGCFADWYHWRDGIGPRAERPVHDTQFWTAFAAPGADPGLGRLLGPPETNAFGTDEFLQYCLDTDAEPMLVANFGSGDPQEAADWVRYCNVDRKAPRPVHWWSVGNEVFGPWEIGHCSGEEYGKKLVEFAEAMKAVDPTIKIVGVGEMATPGSTWNADVLAHAGGVVDAVSAHFYFPGPGLGRPMRDDENDFLQVATAGEELGRDLDDTLAELDAAVGPARALPLSLDEWNLWDRFDDLLHTSDRLADSLLYAGFLNRIYDRADRVTFAMFSQLVNCIGAIQTDGDRMFVTTAYLVQRLYRHTARASTAPVRLSTEQLRVPELTDLSEQARAFPFAQSHGVARTANALDACATRDPSGVTVFLGNRRLDSPVQVTLSGLPAGAPARLRWLHAESPWSRNTVDHPDAVRVRQLTTTTSPSGVVTVEVPPHTVAALQAESS
jgi:alpha-L-arabinofuranosidase